MPTEDPVELALELGEERGRRLLESLGARAAVRELRRRCATRYAMDLMRAGEKDRSVIRDRLMTRHHIGRTVAYECLEEALHEFAKLSAFDRCSRTRLSQDAGVETSEAKNE